MLGKQRIPGWWWVASLAVLLLNLHPLRLQGQGGRHQWRQVHMGVEIVVTAYADPARAEKAAAAAFETIASMEQILSDWRAGSELRRLGESQPHTWHPVSPQLGAVLALALEFAAASDGAFDPTIGALTELWREQRRTGQPPDSATLALAQATVGWHAVRLDESHTRVLLERPGIRFDLGGIAKGWILDRALESMRAAGVTSAMIEAGGDLVAGDSPPGAAGWRIAVGDTVVTLSHTALAASGPSMQFVVDPDGTSRSHVIDPTTGRGLSRQREVAVSARSGGVADALATTLTLVPESGWAGLLARFDATLVDVTNPES